MNKVSVTNWDRVDALSDAEIDTSDIPPLDAAFFARATVRVPASGVGKGAPAAEQTILAHAAETVPPDAIRRLLDAGVSAAELEAGIRTAIERYLAEELERA